MRCLFSLALVATTASTATAQEAVYRFRIDEQAPRVLHVRARLPAGNGVLSIGGYHPEPKGKHWGDHVRALTVSTTEREPVELHRRDRNSWSFDPGDLDTVRVDYRVRLDHDAGPWPPSHAEATYVREDCVFVRGFAVLLVTDGVTGVRVVLDLPEAWQVTTPLRPAEDDPRELVTETKREALDTGLMLGTHSVTQLEIDAIELDIGVSSDLPGAIDAMVGPFRAALEEAAEIFGGTPKKRYAIIAARKTAGSGYSGSGLGNGMSVLLTGSPSEDKGGLWTFVLTHELLHMWVGGTIGNRGTRTQEWFHEGMADYLAFVVCGRRGLLRKGVGLGYLGGMWNGYLNLAGERSLTAAGDEKARFYDFIYGGGMYVALLLDMELRRATAGERRIDDLMHALNVEFGLTGTALTTDELQRVVNGLAGEDLGWIFDDFVRGDVILEASLVLDPVGLIPGRIGKSDAPRSTMRIDPDATPEAVALRRAIFGFE